MEQKQQVFWSVENQVMTIRVDNPATKNGLDWQGINQLSDCYERMMADPSIRVGVLTGNDRYFYTGGRVDPTAPGESGRYTDALTRFLRVSGALTTPMIAAVNGDCMKAGMGVLCQCDFAVAREGVRFSFPEVRMGGVPMMVLVDIVDRMPRKRALEALLTIWEFSAAEALQMGLVNRVVPEEAFWPTVDRFVRAVCDTDPVLINMTRRAYLEMAALPDRDARIDYADASLRGPVLTTMAHRPTEYNV